MAFQDFKALVLAVAKRHDYPADLLAGQAAVESAWNPQARSHAGAVGLMQFMPATWGEWGHGDPCDPEAALDAGVRYMQWLLGQVRLWPEPLECALAAYNAGIGTVKRARLRAGFEREKASNGWAAIKSRLPLETQAYVERTLAQRPKYALVLKEE